MSAERIPVRATEAGDVVALTALLNAIIRIGGTTALETPLDPETFDTWFVSGPDVLCCTTALDPVDGSPCGFQVLSRYGAPGPGWADIGTFARAERKVRGVGTALFQATRARAAELGLASIQAQIRADNTGGLAYYDAMGFSTYQVLAAVPLADGTPVDRICKRFDVA